MQKIKIIFTINELVDLKIKENVFYKIKALPVTPHNFVCTFQKKKDKYFIIYLMPYPTS